MHRLGSRIIQAMFCLWARLYHHPNRLPLPIVQHYLYFLLHLDSLLIVYIIPIISYRFTWLCSYQYLEYCIKYNICHRLIYQFILQYYRGPKQYGNLQQNYILYIYSFLHMLSYIMCMVFYFCRFSIGNNGSLSVTIDLWQAIAVYTGAIGTRIPVSI